MLRESHLYMWALVIVLVAVAAAVADEHESDPESPKMEDLPKLTVRGEAELEKPADQMHLSVGVLSENRDADEALDENSTKMRAVIDAIKDAGLTEDEYETGQFRIRPQYARRPRQPEPDWKPRIIGYEVQNTIKITTQKLELAGELLAAANRAGANTADVKGFDLADPRQYRAEAIRTATANALADAATLAHAANLELVRILSINLDHTPVRPIEAPISAMRAMGDAGAAPPPITAGEVTIRANVTVVYEIAPKES
jgi:uncharacterized protein YggE